MIRATVVSAWQEISQSQRKELRRLAIHAKNAGIRCRCKLVLALVQGKTPIMIALGGLCAKSQVYRVAGRFITKGLVGLADRREDNGERKIHRSTSANCSVSSSGRHRSLATGNRLGPRNC